MRVRSLGFRTDLALLTMSGSQVDDRGSYLVVRTPANPTFRWGNFLLLDRPPAPGGEREVLDVFDDELPAADHYAIGIDGTDDQRDAVAGFAPTGLEVTSASVLTAGSLVAPPRTPESAELRALEGDEDWEQRLALLATVNAEEGSPASVAAFARGKVAQERGLVAAGHGQRYGAFLDGRLLSTAAVFRTEPGVARYQSVETHPEARRQGLASAVVHAAGQHALESLGATTLVIVADPEDGAIRVYRALGFAETERMLELELSL